MPRRYQLKQRAERQEQTRRRIIQAAIELHAHGPASISAIARQAGVGRVTVYRHFPDERALVIACTSAFFDARPLPDPATFEAIGDPARRLRAALDALYAYYGDHEPLLASAEAGVTAHPDLIEGLRPMIETLGRLRDVLAAGWSDGGAPASVVAAAIGHALAFSTWRSLLREQELPRSAAVDLMVSLVQATGRQVEARLPTVSPAVLQQRRGD